MFEQKIFHFPETGPITALELYLLLYERFREMDSICYICAPVTSAVTEDEELSEVPVRIERNVHRNAQHLENLERNGKLQYEWVFLPSQVGSRYKMNIEGSPVKWDERDYNILMMLILLRVDPQHAASFVQSLTQLVRESAAQAMSDYYGSFVERVKHYKGLGEAVVASSQNIRMHPMPVIVMPEWPKSLGCILENFVVDQLQTYNAPVVVYDLLYQGPSPVLQQRT